MTWLTIVRASWLTNAEWTCLGRLALCYGGALALRSLINLQIFAPLLGHPSFEIVNEHQFPLVLPGLLLGVLFLWLRAGARMTQSVPFPGWQQATVAILVLAATSMAVLALLHPTPVYLSTVNQFIARDLEFRNSAAIAAVYLAYFVPIFPAFFVLFHWSFLRTHLPTILSGWALYAAYLMSDGINAGYYRLTGPKMTKAIQFIVSWLPGGASSQPSRWDITYRGFTVTFGSACTELTAVVLLLGFLAFVYWRRPPRSIKGAFVAGAVVTFGAAGLLCLNLLRIVFILAVGSWYPAFAIGLFHGGIGAALLFGYIAALAKLALLLAAKDRAPCTR